MNTYTSLHPRPDFDRFYCSYIKGDAAKEPITTGESIPALLPMRPQRLAGHGATSKLQRSVASDTRN
jgi:hypothetical protein